MARARQCCPPTCDDLLRRFGRLHVRVHVHPTSDPHRPRHALESRATSYGKGEDGWRDATWDGSTPDGKADYALFPFRFNDDLCAITIRTQLLSIWSVTGREFETRQRHGVEHSGS